MGNRKDVSMDKIPPQNIEAEMSALGSMLMDDEAISRAIEVLDADSFYTEAHKKIYSAIIDAFDRHEAVDLVTITERLKKGGELEQIGGASYLASLMNVVPSAANIQHYAKIVHEKAVLRKLIETSTNIIRECYESKEDADTLMDLAEKWVFEAAKRKRDKDFLTLRDVLKDSFETIEELYQKKIPITGLPTGFKDLDGYTSGLQRSDLIIIAGRPSSGKTALALNIARHIGVEEKIPVAFFSLEMSKEQLVQRLLCTEARVSMHKLRTGYLAESDWPKLTIAAGRLSEAPIFIDDTPAISVLELRAKARRLKAKQNIGLVVVDYLQLMQVISRRSENRQQEISEISQALKALAKELNIPVVALSQLSRAVESRSDHRPQLSDLRESGAIEQDGDLVAFIFRKEIYDPSPENEGMAEIIIGKQRNGPIGSLKLSFLKEFTRFENIAFTRVE